MATKNRLRVIPLGGAGEVGRNCWVLEYENDVLILDMGVMFPDAEMLGVDLILPDVTYLQERKANIRWRICYAWSRGPYRRDSIPAAADWLPTDLCDTADARVDPAQAQRA